ncbi:hypothetical protein DVH26_34120 [Paenibacillus sp. H1-7]|uniref:hypothetical protein n=1 Tax=Paenibacillus sp. H1-7 TaxID=2282849 RepID=UPI001EF91AAC|nr:hypothetical protein [Paenibacillus sp. H1-7]ULL19026.1 hypothetical protein DVH26_34120 [Paenibacillus sp. H1-7]
MKILSMFSNRKVVLWIIIALSVITMTAGFYGNYWKSVDQGRFTSFQIDSESLVVGKMVKSEKEGIFSNSGLMGTFDNIPNGGNDKFLDQYKLFSGELAGGEYQRYTSQIGLQGIAFSIINKISPFEKKEDLLKYLKLINSLLFSLILTIFIVWVYIEFNSAIVSLFVLLTILYSEWLVLFGRNLYWITWAMFLPFIISLVFLYLEDKSGKFKNKLYIILIYLAVFIKCASGYEYLSTILLAMIAPVIYYGISRKWGIKKVVLRILMAGTTAVLSFFSTVFLNLYQLSLEFGSFRNAANTIWTNVLKRTHASGDNFSASLKESLDASIVTVLDKYWSGEVINLSNIVPTSSFVIFTAEKIILIFIIATVMVFSSNLYFPTIAKLRVKLISLSVTLWFSFLAPVSWFILAKGHSFIHTHMNHILWQIPFTLYGFVLTGIIAKCVVYDLNKRYNYFKQVIIGVIIIILLGSAYSIYSSSKVQERKIDELINKSVASISVENFRIYINLENSKIIYVDEVKNDTRLENKFYLHIIPLDNNFLSEERRQYGFDNLDFYFFEAKNISNKYHGLNATIKDLPSYGIKSIETGQFNDGGRTWEKAINVSYDKYNSGKIIPEKINDDNWKNGISANKKIVLIKYNLQNMSSILNAKYVVLKDGSKVKITNIEFINSEWIHVNLEQEIDDTNGYPNRIDIVK